MDITIKKLTPQLCEEFLYYFDHIAFADHEDWSFCYCLECHLDKETQENTAQDKLLRRKMAENFVKTGVMKGYLAYDGDKVIGWCNSDDKVNYVHLSEDSDYHTEDTEKGKIKVAYCFDISYLYRGKGIASQMLQLVCSDAKAEGYSYVEAYPFTDINFDYQYHGTIQMYIRNGFEIYDTRKWFQIMRKSLI